MSVNLSRIERVIKSRKLMDEWGDGLFVETEQDKEERAQKKKSEVIRNFINMMSSPKNNGTDEYETWAINKALGLVGAAMTHGKFRGRRR